MYAENVCAPMFCVHVCVCVSCPGLDLGSLPEENQGLAQAWVLVLFLRKPGHYTDPSGRKKERWVWLLGLSPVEKGFPLG